MSQLYHATLTKPAAIDGQEILPGTPLLIDLWQGETPDYFMIHTRHKVFALTIGNPQLIGEIALIDIKPLIKWGAKRKIK